MFSNKKNVAELLSILREYTDTAVLCPGSRNIPLVQSMADDPHFHCCQITDERSAGFFACGLSLQKRKPVAVCCTSGSALLNLHPAVSEAFYQKIPLIIISADRPAAWIGQMDGQTLPQDNVFGSLVKRSVTLSESEDLTETLYRNRLINEALQETEHDEPGPVHINVPISEPFFAFNEEKLPQCRTLIRFSMRDSRRFTQLMQIQGKKTAAEREINSYDGRTLSGCEKKLISSLCTLLADKNKVMLITGQSGYAAPALTGLNEKGRKLICECFAVVAENTANCSEEQIIRKADLLLLNTGFAADERSRPDLVITTDGHIISKRLKQYLRSCRTETEHMHTDASGRNADLFHALKYTAEMKTEELLTLLCDALNSLSEEERQALSPYPSYMLKAQSLLPAPDFAYSQLSVTGEIQQHLPEGSVLHLANSSTVRYSQLFASPKSVTVMSNRGVNGIEGSLSTAAGYAAADTKRLNFVFIGDLSFFYDMNALWNRHINDNLRILLLNNGGGEIFHALPGLHMSEEGRRFITGTHETSAQKWAESCGFKYMRAEDRDSFTACAAEFTAKEGGRILLEIFTSQDKDTAELKRYYDSIRACTLI